MIQPAKKISDGSELEASHYRVPSCSSRHDTGADRSWCHMYKMHFSCARVSCVVREASEHVGETRPWCLSLDNQHTSTRRP